ECAARCVVGHHPCPSQCRVGRLDEGHYRRIVHLRPQTRAGHHRRSRREGYHAVEHAADHLRSRREIMEGRTPMSELQTIAPAMTTHPSGDVRFASLDQTIEHYNHEPTALIQVLHAAQHLFGYLSTDVLRYVATALKLPLSQVYGVVTFYHLFTMVPRGKHQILVCT